jgi:2-dehydropantoate 2-reductase
MDAAIAEVRRLSAAEGHPLTDEDVGRWREVMAGLDPDGKTSMLQDVEAQRKTEVEMFAGVVCRLGESHGIATPTNAMLLELIHYRERGYGAL